MHVFVDQDDSPPTSGVWIVRKGQTSGSTLVWGGTNRFETRLSPNKPGSAI